LIWNLPITQNQQSAGMVIGQPNMNSGTENYGGLGAVGLSYPYPPQSDGTRLFIVDFGNLRILGYNHIPTSVLTPADFVLGQNSFTAAVDGTASPTSQSMSYAGGLCTSSNQSGVFRNEGY
jgi:hypothetical protein